jgi:hypothetical protein
VGFSAPAPASSPVCAKLARWLDAEDRAKAPNYTRQERHAWRKAAFAEKHRVAGLLFEDLLKGKLARGAIDSCVAGRPDYQDPLNFLQSQFLQKGLERLGRSAHPSIQAFLAMLQERFPGGVLFRMTGHFREQSPSELMAGYHRSSQSIYMDWDKVPANEWLLILAHELLHSLDTRIWDGLEVAGLPENLRRVRKLVRRNTRFATLAEEDSRFLDHWVRAGLDLGLWAEFRAWLATLAIYEAGLQDRLWSPIPWMDRMVARCPAGPDRARCFYLYIDARSPDPTTGFVASPLVLQQIRKIRAEQRLWRSPLDAGPLAPIVSGETRAAVVSGEAHWDGGAGLMAR